MKKAAAQRIKIDDIQSLIWFSEYDPTDAKSVGFFFSARRRTLESIHIAQALQFRSGYFTPYSQPDMFDSPHLCHFGLFWQNNLHFMPIAVHQGQKQFNSWRTG